MAQDIEGTSDLTSGAYEKPTATDSGSTVFKILESFMERMAAHKHEGTDSLLINKKLDKTPYDIAADTDDWTGPDANGNKKVTITMTGTGSSDHYLAASDTGADADVVLDITREFYYLKDNTTGLMDEHVRFYPDIVWTGNNTLEVHTNIYETIAAAAGTPVVIMKVY